MFLMFIIFRRLVWHTPHKPNRRRMRSCTVANKSTCYALVRDLFFLVVYSSPASVKVSHWYTKTDRELIGGIHVKRETAPPLVNSVTRQFSHVSQPVATGGLVMDCTLARKSESVRTKMLQNDKWMHSPLKDTWDVYNAFSFYAFLVCVGSDLRVLEK